MGRDGILPRDPLSFRPVCPNPAEAMPSPGTICSLLLLSVLCVDLAMAGSSFLSPEHQKVQVRCLPTKPHILILALPHSSQLGDLSSGSASLGTSLLRQQKGPWVWLQAHASLCFWKEWGHRALRKTPPFSNRERSPRSHQPNCNPESSRAGSAQKTELRQKGQRMSWKFGLVPL